MLEEKSSLLTSEAQAVRGEVITLTEQAIAPDASNEPVISIEHMVKRYKKAETNAVDDVSFQVARGTFFALLGPNGAGKSTIISILTTMLSLTAGKLRIAGYNPITHPTEVRRHIGIVFQRPSLDLNLTAEENVRLHAMLYGLYPYRPVFALMPRSYKDRVKNLPWYLDIISKLSPMRYIIDFTRALFYAGQPTYSQVVLESPWIDLTVSVLMFLVFFITGTLLFVRHERNR